MVARPAQDPAYREGRHGNYLTSGLPLWKGKEGITVDDGTWLDCCAGLRPRLGSTTEAAEVTSPGLVPGHAAIFCPRDARVVCVYRHAIACRRCAVSGVVVSCRSTKCPMQLLEFIPCKTHAPRQPCAAKRPAQQPARFRCMCLAGFPMGFPWPVLSCLGWLGWVPLFPGCGLH